MDILLFGVSNVGKTTVGRILAEKLGIEFYDLDDEIKKYYGITLEEFVNTGTVKEQDKKRGGMIGKLLQKESDKIVAVCPMSYSIYFKEYINRDNVLAIELRDTPENIFDRLVFSDEDDYVYTDDEYKEAHKEYYMRDIREDIEWYGESYADIINKYDINNKNPEEVADSIIREYKLMR